MWLTRRKALQQIFAALVEQRRRAPGTGIPIDEVREARWPGERISAEPGRARVYTAVSSLRTMGLGEILMRRPDGYRLDPNVPLKTTEATDASGAPPLGVNAIMRCFRRKYNLLLYN